MMKSLNRQVYNRYLFQGAIRADFNHEISTLAFLATSFFGSTLVASFKFGSLQNSRGEI